MTKQPTLSIATPARLALLGGLVWMVATPGAAQVEPGVSASGHGEAQATLLEGISVAEGENLRFGPLISPKSNGTLTVDSTGAVVSTAGISLEANIAAPGTRGPASFDLVGSPDRIVSIQLPDTVNLTSGAVSMRIDGLAGNHEQTTVKLDNSGYFKLLVGGRLNVAAGQPSGLYKGSFEVTVLYE